MGTVRTWLRDDVETPYWEGKPAGMFGRAAGLDDDVPERDPCAPAGGAYDPAPMNPPVVLLMRTRAGYTPDGAPQFVWARVAEGEPVAVASGQEFNATTGVQLVTATFGIRYTGTVPVTPNAVALWRGATWQITAARTVGDVLQMKAQRYEWAPPVLATVDPDQLPLALAASLPTSDRTGGEVRVLLTDADQIPADLTGNGDTWSAVAVGPAGVTLPLLLDSSLRAGGQLVLEVPDAVAAKIAAAGGDWTAVVRVASPAGSPRDLLTMTIAVED